MPDSSDGADRVSLEAEATRVAKINLRATVLAHRRALPAARRAVAAGRVQATLTDLVRTLRPTRVAGYAPMGSEPGGDDLPEVLRAALAPAGVLLLPVLRPDLDLDWAAYSGPDALAAAPAFPAAGPDSPTGGRSSPAARPGSPAARPGSPGARSGRGMREPTGPRLGPTAIADAELVIVPAVAVDRRGIRLGRGGGSYDRALARVGAGALVVAPLHDGELVDVVPAEPHDRPVDAVITPTLGFQQLKAGPEVIV